VLRAGLARAWPAPVALDAASEPAPDLTVVRGSPRDYAREHPARPVLLVEVAQSSVVKDRGLKAGLHARAGIGDYWVLNLVDRVLEVRRDPERASSGRAGWRYRSLAVLPGSGAVAPLAKPRARVGVADLLP
jgi:Uma2 family endonuclease